MSFGGPDFRTFYKRAFELHEADTDITKANKLFSDTVGRLAASPVSLLTQQESFIQDLKGADKETLEKELKHLRKDKRLKDLAVRLNHFNPKEDIERNLKMNGPIVGPLGLVGLPFIWAHNAGLRSNNYVPSTKTVHLYSGIPEVAHHELGHARDFNTTETSRGIRVLASALENGIIKRVIPPGIPFAGPVTQMLESNANTEAEKGYRKDMREFRRKLWPSRGTYWGATLAGAGLLASPELRENLQNFVAKTDADDVYNNPITRGILASLIPVGVGALGGRLFAETRNLFDSGKKEKKAEVIDLKDFVNFIGKNYFTKDKQ
jgi:hypothetical protein